MGIHAATPGHSKTGSARVLALELTPEAGFRFDLFGSSGGLARRKAAAAYGQRLGRA